MQFCGFLVGMQLNLRPFFVKRRLDAFLGPLAWLTVAAAGAWVLSGQIWRFVLPRPAPHLELVVSPGEAAAAIAGRHVFGTATATSPPAVPVETSYRLLGVIAASAGQSAAAVLQLQNGSSVVVGVGAEVEAGVRLSTVGARSVQLRRGNGEITLALPEPGGAGK